MSVTQQGKQQFQDRLKRIRSGGPNTLGQVYVGVIDPTDPKKASGHPRVPRMSFMMLILSFILGAMAMEAGRLGAFHFLTGDPVVLIEKFGKFGGFVAGNMGDLVIAAFLSIIFMYLFRLRGNWRGTALVVGLVSMMLGEVHLMQRAPGAFALIFSESFVEMTLGIETIPAPVQDVQDTVAEVAN